MVNIEKHLIEVEACRKKHIERDNTFTVAVLEQASEVAKELQKYRDAEEQGLLLRLPCKVGTPVYSITQDCGGDTLDCRCMDCEDCRYLYTYVEQRAFDTYMCDEIGKTVFLTKEEAEQKLASMQKGESNGNGS